MLTPQTLEEQPGFRMSTFPGKPGQAGVVPWSGQEDSPVGGLKITKKMGSWGRKENFVMTFSGIFLM